MQKKTIFNLKKPTEDEKLLITTTPDVRSNIYPILNSYKHCMFWIPTQVQKEKIFRYIYETPNIDYKLFKDIDDVSEPLIGIKAQEVTLKQELRKGMTEVTTYPTVMLHQPYYIDIVECPAELISEDKLLTLSKFDKFVKTSDLIQEKQTYLESKGYIYVIHYHMDTIVNKVIADGTRITQS